MPLFLGLKVISNIVLMLLIISFSFYAGGIKNDCSVADSTYQKSLQER